MGMIVSICLVLIVLSKFVCRKRLRIPKTSKKVNFQATGLAVFLFILGKILDTLFKLIACRSVGSTQVHWYFGYEDCYGTTWFLALSFLIVMILVFGGVFVYGSRMLPEERANPNKLMYQLSARFKPEYWYWEYVLFFRRILISWFAVGVSAALAKLIFLFTMIAFTVCQWRSDPFASPQSNQMEFILLCALPLVITSQFATYQTDSLESFVVALVSLLILLPIPLVFCYGMNLLKEGYKGWSSTTKDLEMTLNEDTQNGAQHTTSNSTSDDIINFTTSPADGQETGTTTTGTGTVQHERIVTNTTQKSSSSVEPEEGGGKDEVTGIALRDPEPVPPEIPGVESGHDMERTATLTNLGIEMASGSEDSVSKDSNHL